MLWGYVFFLVPTLLFVIAFLYETFLSFMRLRNPRVGKTGYLAATWEVTHTLLVFAVVMLLMLYTKAIDQLASAIFVSTFVAALALTVRAACYIQIFYVRKRQKTGLLDWVFALSHLAAAVPLVITVLQAVWFLATKHPEINEQFIGPFIPGLVLVLGVCLIPIFTLYKTKD